MYVHLVLDEKTDDNTSFFRSLSSVTNEEGVKLKTIYAYDSGDNLSPTWMTLIQDLIEVIEGHYGYKFDLKELEEKQ